MPADHKHGLDCAAHDPRAAKALKADGPRVAFDGAVISPDDVVPVLRLLQLDRQASEAARELSRKTQDYGIADSEIT